MKIRLPFRYFTKTPLAFSLFVFCYSFSFGQLNGTYTIDANGSGAKNFTSFTNAANALNKSGINSPVVFNIADGTYQEDVYIRTINGSSSTNTITFQSASGDSSKVILTDTTVTNNYSDTTSTLYLDIVSFMTFKQITIQRTGINSAGNSVVRMNSTKGCSFLNDAILTSICEADIIIAHGDSGNVYKNNLFIAPQSAIQDTSRYKGASRYEVNFVFEKNRIELYDSLSNISLWIFNVNTLDISENIFSGVLVAIEIENCTGNIRVSKNNISCAGAGIEALYCRGTAFGPSIISNNRIFVDDLGWNIYEGFGILAEADSNFLIVYNSINIDSFSPYMATGILLSENTYPPFGGKNNVLNNNIVSSRSSYCISVDTIISTDTINYNNLYTIGNIIAIYDTLYETSLSDWQKATGFDLNSISVNPLFSSSTNLYPYSTKLAAGTPVSEVKDDIEGNLRSTSKPDIGPYEFAIFKNDAKVLSIDSPGPGNCGGAYDVYVTLLNTGANTLKTATINWKVDGNVQPSYQWTGALPLLGKAPAIKIGSYFLSAGVPLNIACWITGPNGVTDSNKINDSTFHTLLTGLSGTYTIGGTNPDYVDFPDAIYDLYYRGLCGPVTYNVANGYYYNIIIHSIAGSSKINRVTFQSASGDSSKVIIVSSNIYGFNENVLELDSANYITMNKMTILGIIVLNNTNNDSIANCVNQSGYINEISGNGSTYYNNLINETYTGNFIKDNSRYPKSGPKIINNTFASNLDFSIAIFNSHGFLIQGNKLGSVPGNTDTAKGIYTSGCDGNWQIYGNRISVYGGIGLDLNNTGTGLIANNMISVSVYNDYSGNISINPIGGVSLLADSLNFYFNNIFIKGGTNPNSYGLNTEFNTKYLNIANNNIENHAEGYAISIETDAFINTMDYNNYQPDNNIGRSINGTIGLSLKDWQNITGMDAHSLSINPMYVSSTNLRATNDTLKGKGVQILGIKKDINGLTRPAPPTIGANELGQVGIKTISYKPSITLYPNPAINTLNIESATSNIQSVTIFDATGREVYSETGINFFIPYIRDGKVVVPVNNFPSGIYFVKIGLDNGIYEGKFMKE